jgi:hypothetical protein
MPEPTIDQIRELVNRGIMLSPENARILLAKIDCLAAELNSETRWVKHYFDKWQEQVQLCNSSK